MADAIIALNQLDYSSEVIIEFMKWYKGMKQLEKSSEYDVDLDRVDYTEMNESRGNRTNFYGIYKMMEHDLEKTYNNDIASFISDRFPAVSGGIAGALYGESGKVRVHNR